MNNTKIVQLDDFSNCPMDTIFSSRKVEITISTDVVSFKQRYKANILNVDELLIIL